MYSESELSCETCKYKTVDSAAVHYCTECEEGLCNDCYQHHTHSKTSRNHGVIPLEYYQKLPGFIRDIKHYCKEHDEKFEFYCPIHNSPSCKKAISTEHKDCKGIKPINDVILGIKTSSDFSRLGARIKQISHNLDIIIKDKEINLSEINESRQKFKNEIKDIRSKIESLLDSLEMEIEDKLSSVEKQVASKLEDITKELKEKAIDLGTLKKNLDAVKDHASDFQTFVGMNELKAGVSDNEKYLQLLSKDSRLDRISISCTINDKIKSFIKETKNFGDISTERSPSNGLLGSTKPIENQTVATIPPAVAKMPRSKPSTAVAVKVKVKRKLTILPGRNKNTITGCTILPNGKFVFVDGTYNQRVVILNSNGTSSGEISLSPSFAFDVACIDAKTIAITTGSSGQIAIVNVMTKKIKKFIGTTWQCDGISHCDGKLIMAVYSKGIHVLKLDTCQITTIHNENITVDTHVTTLDDRIYHTNWKANTVTCYDMNGKVEWTYHDEKVLKKPRGIAVDPNHNVYVASLGTEGVIIVLSPDGKQGRPLLSTKDEIENVRAICFDKMSNCLLVSSLTGSVSLFDVT